MINAKFSIGEVVNLRGPLSSLDRVVLTERRFVERRWFRHKETGIAEQHTGWVYKTDATDKKWVLEKYIHPYNPPSNTEDAAYTEFKSTLEFSRVNELEIA